MAPCGKYGRRHTASRLANVGSHNERHVLCCEHSSFQGPWNILKLPTSSDCRAKHIVLEALRQNILYHARPEGCLLDEEKVEKGFSAGISRTVAACACLTWLFGDSKSSGARSIEWVRCRKGS